MSHSLLEKALANYASPEPTPAVDLFAPQFVRVGTFDIRYVRSEKPNAPVLVMLNGLPQSIRMWESAWNDLADQFDLIAFDIPGFGLSQAEESDMSPRQLSDVVIQVMDHFAIDKAHLVGPDVGVPITLAAAIKYPERFHSINIFDGPGTYPPRLSPVLMTVIKSKFVRWMAKGINKKPVMKTNFMVAVKEGYHHYRPTERAIKEYYDIAYNEQSHLTMVSFFSTYQTDLPWIESQLSQLQVPALITWGKEDTFVLPDNADRLAALIPQTKQVMFDNASHFSSEDAGDEYVQTLSAWCLGEFEQNAN